jgi:hypothetical protein
MSRHWLCGVAAALAIAASGAGRATAMTFVEHEGPGYAEYPVSRLATYENFLERCGRDKRFCVTVAGYMRHLRASDSGPKICVPESVTDEIVEAKVEALLRSSLGAHPEWKNEPATENIYLAIAFFWPCQ